MSIGIIPALVIAIGAVPALLGVLFFRLSLRGRRGDQPHCRGCDYLLIGIRSSRCPECGRELLPRGIVRGELRLDRLRLAQGFAFVMLASGCFWSASTPYVRSIDYYNYWPASWVVQDASRTSPDSARRAWKELGMRRSAGRLDEKCEKQLIDIALMEEAKPREAWGPLHDEMSEHLASLLTNGKLSDLEIEQFFQRITSRSLQVRSVVLKGSGIKCRVAGDGCWVSRGGWYVLQRLEAIGIDGVAVNPQLLGSFHRLSSELTVDLPSQPEGVHGIIAYWSSELHEPTIGPPVMNWKTSCMRHTQVVADPSKEGLVELDQPDLADKIRSVITVEIEEVDEIISRAGAPMNLPIHPLIPLVPTSSSVGTISAWKQPSLMAKLTADGVPVNIAFEVSVRMKTREVNVGLISVAKAGIGVFILGIPNDGKTSLADVDVILRSSAKASRESVDVTAFWKGEITFPSVKIRRRGPSSMNAFPTPYLLGGGRKR